jgi:hypothetical protein
VELLKAITMSVRLRLSGRLVLLVPILIACHVSAQQSPGTCLQQTIPLAILEDPNAAKLESKDISVTVEGHPVSVVSLRQDNLAPRIVLLVDTSGSMAQENGSGWGPGLFLSGFAFDAVPENSSVALGTFTDEAHFSGLEERNAIGQRLLALKDIRPRGRTALYSAIEKTISLLNPPQPGDAIFIVSDGGDDAGDASEKTVQDELIESGIRVFVFLVKHLRKTEAERQGELSLPDLARMTGGSSIQPQPGSPWFKDMAAMELTLKAIRAQVQNSYWLDLQLQSAQPKPARLKITSTTKGLQLAYPYYIEPCGSSSETRVAK